MKPEEREHFRAEVASWLQANLPSEPFPSPDTAEGFEVHRAWEQRLFEAGFAAVHWPVAFGGRGLDTLATAVFEEEYNRAGGPERLNIVGLHICGPTLMEYGTPEQQQRWLPDLLGRVVE